MEKKSLYGLTSELNQIEKLLEESEQTELFEKQVELTALLMEKCDSVVYYHQSQNDFLDAISSRIKELQELKKSVERKQERYESYILTCLDSLGVEKINGTLTSIKIPKPRQVVEVFDENLLNPDFFRIKTIVETDKIALKKALDDGQEVQGARLKLSERKVQLKVGK